MEFRTRFHFWKVYVTLGFAMLIFLGMAALLMSEFIRNPGYSKIILILIATISAVFGLCMMYSYVKQLPVIRINYTGVTLRNPFGVQRFTWSEVESMRYTGKSPFSFAMGFPREAVEIQLKDKRLIRIFYEYYAKGYHIQQLIRNYYEHKQAPELTKEKRVTSTELRAESFTMFRGTPLLSLRGIMIWGVILFLVIYATINGITGRSAVPLIIFCLIFYFANSHFCFYIKLSDNYLVMKNYFIPFIGHKYRLSDIQKIIVETQPKWPNCLRIVTNSFRYKVFPCGPLTKEEWWEFLEIIEKKGVKTRNEAF